MTPANTMNRRVLTFLFFAAMLLPFSVAAQDGGTQDNADQDLENELFRLGIFPYPQGIDADLVEDALQAKQEE